MKRLVKQLVVIGGGPAGCAAAIAAKNAGIQDVSIIEKEPTNRHRVGEILLTQTILEMQELGIAEEMREAADRHQWGRKFAAAYVHGKDRTPWKVQNNHPLASSEDQPHIPRCFIDDESKLWFTLMVRRHEFDLELRNAAKRRGVEIIEGFAKEVEIKRDGDPFGSFVSKIVVECESNEHLHINAGFVIDATGQHAVIPRLLGKRKTIDDWGLQSRYSYFTEVDFETAKSLGFFEQGANILSYEDGWAWIACLGKGLVSVGIVSRQWDKGYDSFFEKLKRLPEYDVFGLGHAKQSDCYGNPAANGLFYAHPNYRNKSEEMRGANWACCGDSAMFLDPLLSQGVTLAFSFGRKLGQAAAGILENGQDPSSILEGYERAYHNELEILNKIVSLWYSPDFTIDSHWKTAARKMSNAFSRKIGDDVESFRWISNLENIHHVMNGLDDEQFLSIISSDDSLVEIAEFEKNGFVSV